MAEKRIQENPIPDVSTAENNVEIKDKTMKLDKADKTPALPPPIISPTPSQSMFSKNPPSDLYRRLLPAVLFLLTFVTVMTMLLIYMDTVALGAQQFRLNMTRDYELGRIGQRSPALIQYVRQLHLASSSGKKTQVLPPPSQRLPVIDSYFGDQYNGTFVEFFPRGGRNPTTLYLELQRGWTGLAVRAATADFLSVRTAPAALHACLSPSQHPREVSYPEGDSREGAFMSRVLCLPLLTVLAAAERTSTDYVVLAGESVLPALHVLPFEDVQLKLLEIYSSDAAYRNKTTSFLQSKNYTVAAIFDDSVMYVQADKKLKVLLKLNNFPKETYVDKLVKSFSAS